MRDPIGERDITLGLVLAAGVFATVYFVPYVASTIVHLPIWFAVAAVDFWPATLLLLLIGVGLGLLTTRRTS